MMVPNNDAPEFSFDQEEDDLQDRLLELFKQHMKQDAGLSTLETDQMALLKLFHRHPDQVIPQNRDFAKTVLRLKYAIDTDERG